MRLSQRGVAIIAVLGFLLGLVNLYLGLFWMPRLNATLNRLVDLVKMYE